MGLLEEKCWGESASMSQHFMGSKLRLCLKTAEMNSVVSVLCVALGHACGFIRTLH